MPSSSHARGARRPHRGSPAGERGRKGRVALFYAPLRRTVSYAALTPIESESHVGGSGRRFVDYLISMLNQGSLTAPTHVCRIHEMPVT